MIFKIIVYTIYMLIMRIKGLHWWLIKKIKGESEATEYTFMLYEKWARFTTRLIGIDIEVDGLENIPNESCVFVGNHTSILDIPILMNCVDLKLGFISKKEVLDYPIIGFWLRKGKNVPLDRNNVRQGIQAINEGVDNVKNGYSMVVFPEGTRSKTGEILEFKKGSLKLATKSKSKIVPVYIEKASRFFEDERRFVGGKIKVSFLEPIDTKVISKDEEKMLAENIRSLILEASKK